MVAETGNLYDNVMCGSTNRSEATLENFFLHCASWFSTGIISS